MRIYLAARYSRREELLSYAAQLADLGFQITSRWLTGSHRIGSDGLSAQAAEAERSLFAQEDWEDLQQADLCISFTEPPLGTNSRGGRHVEYGIALALGKRCMVVGYRENVFHCLPQVLFYPDWPEALADLHLIAPIQSMRDQAAAMEGTWNLPPPTQAELR